jgi:hypothetical protein
MSKEGMSPLEAESKSAYWTKEAPKYEPLIFSPETWVYKLSKPHNVANRRKEFCADCFANEKIVELQDGCCSWCTFQLVNLSQR